MTAACISRSFCCFACPVNNGIGHDVAGLSLIGAAVIAAVCLCENFAVCGRCHGRAGAVLCARAMSRDALSSMTIADSTLSMQAAGSSARHMLALDNITGAALVRGIF